jgi:hypothetical protein
MEEKEVKAGDKWRVGTSIIYVLEAIRNGNREEHSYVQGAYFDLDEARKAADEHCQYRALKYPVLVHAFEVGKNYDDDSVPTDFDSEVYRAKGRTL